MKGVIYARYSSHNQREESIEQQIDECKLFALKNDIDIINIYPDKAITGRTDARPNFQRMMRDAEKKKFDVVIAYKSNRISRNMLNALQYETKLDNFGIKTLYAKEEFGNSAAGRFALRTMMNVNQFYSENMSEDIKRGLMDNAEQCKVNKSLPLGYRKSADGKFEIEPSEAAIVREIYKNVIDGWTLADIAFKLNAKGVKTKYGRPFGKHSFHAILTNENYIGVYHYADVRIEGGVPAIVSKEDFQKVQERTKKTKGRKRSSADYILTGKLYCGNCGAYMVGLSGIGHQGNTFRYYSCQSRRVEKSCKKENVRKEWIEEKVAEVTVKEVLTDEMIDYIASVAVAIQQKERKEEEVGMLENQLRQCRTAHRNLLNAIEQGIITDGVKARLHELESEIYNLEKEIENAKAALKPIEKERIIFALEKLKDADYKDAEMQKKIISTFVKAVYLFDDKLRIEYYYGNAKISGFLPSVSVWNTADDSLLKDFLAAPDAAKTNLFIYVNYFAFETAI